MVTLHMTYRGVCIQVEYKTHYNGAGRPGLLTDSSTGSMGLDNSLPLSDPQFLCLKNGHDSCFILFTDLWWEVAYCVKVLNQLCTTKQMKLTTEGSGAHCFILLSNSLLGGFSKGNKWLILQVNLVLGRCHMVKFHTLCGPTLSSSLSHPNNEAPCNSSQRNMVDLSRY